MITTLPAQAGPQFADLAKWHLPPDVDTTQALAYGDVDGDGDLDLVLGNGDGYGFGRQNRLYLNDGTGIFSDVTTARLPRVSDRTTALALGDLDGDGDLDLVVGNGALTISEQNRLFLNDGTGSFTDVTATRMPANIDSTRSVALGDVDGDGDLDLVVGNYGQNRLYRNNGAGAFTEATVGSMPPDSDMTRAVAFGDVDRDGDLDLVFGNGSDVAGQQNRLYLNNGAGSFIDATASRMPLDSDNSSSLTFVDVDRDGDLDLVIGNGAFLVSQQNRLYLNDGMGTFRDATTGRLPAEAEPTSSVAAGDMDGDGDVDLVVGNGELFTSGQ
ncbi:MAG TPA: VCBS repeat-containing protein, partial [Planctomycetota bacterium]|nr:VCBS repeat-containing protein [Planctomycetota bacterium]